MELRQLKYFVEICKTSSFSKAAENCYVSAQGISMSISRLEAELGTQLFVRSSRGISMTTAAKYLYDRAVTIVELSGECDRYFTFGAKYQGTLSVAMAPGSIEEFGGKVINAFSKSNPNIEIEVRELTDYSCEAAVSNEETEIGFACGPVSEKLLDAQLIKSCPYAIIVRRDHPLAAYKSIPVSRIKGIPLVMLRDTTKTYSVIRKACQLEGFEPSVSVFVDNILSVFDLAQINQAVGVSTPLLLGHLGRPELVAIPFSEGGPTWDLYYIKRKGASLSSMGKSFEKTIQQLI